MPDSNQSEVVYVNCEGFLKIFKRVIFGNVREESIVKWRGYRHAFLTLLDEKLPSKVAADYLRLIRNLGSVYFNLT